MLNRILFLFRFTDFSRHSKPFFANRKQKSNVKRHINLAEWGRSMVEMLGVLAIIGVLSVGGMAGYSKAMTKYKINKSVQQIEAIYANVKTEYASNDSYEGLYNWGDIAKLIIPEEMRGGGYGTRNMWNGDSRVFSTNSLTNDNPDGSFIISLGFIPYDACVSLASMDWKSGNDDLIGIIVGGHIVSYVGEGEFGDRTLDSISEGTCDSHACHWIPRTKLPLSPSQAASYCSPCLNDNNRWNGDGTCMFTLNYE